MAKAASLRFRRLDVVELRHGNHPMTRMYRAKRNCGHVIYDRLTADIAVQAMFGIQPRRPHRLPARCPYCIEGREP